MEKILAGFAVGLGATLFLLTGTPILFTLGIFLVVSFGFKLLTGFVPFSSFTDDKYPKLYDILCVALFNLIGAILCGVAIRLSNIDVYDKAVSIVNNKTSLTMLQLIFSGALTGMWIGLGVIIFNVRKKDVIGYCGVIVCTLAFVIFGTEHVVANAYYLATSKTISLFIWFKLLVPSLIGNVVGGILTGKVLKGQQ